MTSRQDWFAGARPRTLPAALVPVAVGTAASELANGVIWWRAACALVVSLALQIGVNYANDYSDGVRGTDDERVGPMRLVGSGAASPDAVKRAAFTSFLIAAIAGLMLAAAAGWWLIAVGFACVGAAWGYTGGKRPYGYMGLGELFVFVFFGLVATGGTAYVQDESFTTLGAFAGIPVGLLAVGLLTTNNLRDLLKDEAVGKRTLAVRLGDHATRIFYAGAIAAVFLCLPYMAIVRPWALIAMASVILAIPPVKTVLGGAAGRDLIPVLGSTARLQLAFGVMLTVGLSLSG
ncbi:MAG: 1,4-dihydroxy-2-naphthoate polyprenyltransferase [Acidimicrobiales bacterium]|jgi:1,4-dihydroxy-2-naphthoate octaprenyltransferase